MTISERLRDRAARMATKGNADALNDAADEIDRLIAENAALRERIAAADAEAVPVAWIATFRRNSPSIDRLLVWQKDDAAKQVAPHLIVSVDPLYARPQPTPDVVVLVKALRKLSGIVTCPAEVAKQALAEWEAKR